MGLIHAVVHGPNLLRLAQCRPKILGYTVDFIVFLDRDIMLFTPAPTGSLPLALTYFNSKGRLFKGNPTTYCS